MFLAVAFVTVGFAAGMQSRAAVTVARQADSALLGASMLEQTRQRDSIALALRLDSLQLFSGAEILRIDAALHAAEFRIAHDTLHRRAVTLRLDSVARLLTTRRVAPAVLAEAQRLLAAPVDSGDAKALRRHAILSRQASGAVRRAATAKPKAISGGGE